MKTWSHSVKPPEKFRATKPAKNLLAHKLDLCSKKHETVPSSRRLQDRLHAFVSNPLEKEMATHSSVLAWKIPWTEGPVGLQSMGSQNWTCMCRVLCYTPYEVSKYMYNQELHPWRGNMPSAIKVSAQRKHLGEDRVKQTLRLGKQ